MNLLITICARGGSKGIPGKNIRSVNGIPLIVYTIHHAQKYAKKMGADIELSTDSDEIKKVAAEAGLTTDYVRPPELATDTAGKLLTMKDLLLYAEKKNGKKYDYLLDLDVTSPLRTMEDLETAFRMLDEHPTALNILSVRTPNHNPYFDMFEDKGDGFIKLIIKPKVQIESRQQSPKVYNVDASIYFYRREFFDHDPMIIIDKTIAYETPHMCFEADEILDFEFLEYVIKENKLDFEFH